MKLNAIIIDFDKKSQTILSEECSLAGNIEIKGVFDDTEKALAFSREENIHLVFAEVFLPYESRIYSLSISKKFREINPDIILIFMSLRKEFVTDAILEYDADYFIIKPFVTEKLKLLMQRIKYLSMRFKKRVFIQTFGNFEVFVDGELLFFPSQKAKEILALFVDRCGESVSTEDAFSVIYENVEYSHQNAANYRHALQKLKNILKNAGIEYILTSSPNGNAICKKNVDCDYFDFLKNDPETIKRYRGIYMSRYSWGEPTLAMLNRVKLKLLPDSESDLFDE